MIVDSSLLTTIRRAVPSISISASSTFSPRSALITVPPVTMAISSNNALRRSPKPGALIATQSMVPRSLLTTRVERASPSTSSAMITKARLLAWSNFSMIPTTSLGALTFWSVIKNNGLSMATSMRWVSLTKCGER